MTNEPDADPRVPLISGAEDRLARHTRLERPAFLPESGIEFGRIRAAASVALHMHQPLIPAGGGDLATAALISNLRHMMDHQHVGDNHNAPVFYQCYKRMGEYIPQLVGEGLEPRVMLEYSGTLLHGLDMIGAGDLFDALRTVTVDPSFRRCVEWLGCPWGHAVAPSTPVQDYRLHVLAWQQHFAALFGWDALERVRGFSPAEMALPNQPDVAYQFVKTLRDCGYRWVIVQEHTVERADGSGLQRRHLPHRLVCASSTGETASITALVKTQGSDTKLVAQMQPYYEAQGLQRLDLAGRSVPPLVTQIADGENGGVMMNEFPPKYIEVVRAASHSEVPLMNGTEYLEHLAAAGVRDEDFEEVRPLHQARIWERMKPGDGPEKLKAAIEDAKRADDRFHMDGGSWTGDISWVSGYENVLGPMGEASALFSRKVLDAGLSPSDPRFRNALYHLMTAQTSCYRYWGQGQWTDYGREICRRAIAVLENKL
jgi:hypothetical protein